MKASERIYISNFVVNPESESICGYDEFFDLDINELPDPFGDEIAVDDDEFIWDDV